MRNIMLIGKSGCGKTSLCQVFSGQSLVDKKTQTVEIVASAIDTPGEYLENRRFHKALLVSSVEAEIILLIQDCADDDNVFPPGFADMFMDKPVWGVVSKTDHGAPEMIAAARDILIHAGATRLFETSALKGLGLSSLIEALSR